MAAPALDEAADLAEYPDRNNQGTAFALGELEYPRMLPLASIE